MTAKRKRPPSESVAAWLARLDTEFDLKWHLASARRVALKLDPKGDRGRRALEQIVVCQKAVRSGQAAAAAVAAFEVCSAVHFARYPVEWEELRLRGTRTLEALALARRSRAGERNEDQEKALMAILAAFDQIRGRNKKLSRRAIAKLLAPKFHREPGSIESLLRRNGRS